MPCPTMAQGRRVRYGAPSAAGRDKNGEIKRQDLARGRIDYCRDPADDPRPIWPQRWRDHTPTSDRPSRPFLSAVRSGDSPATTMAQYYPLLIPLAPLLAALLTTMPGDRRGEAVYRLGLLAHVVAFVLSVLLLRQVAAV